MLDLKVKDYLDLLKSDAPAPGGGSASALMGAQGMALIMMVANLTVGREKYKEFWLVCDEALKKGGKIMADLTEIVEEDTEAYNKVMKAYGMAKDSDAEKALRNKAIRKAMIGATEVPFRAMGICLEGLKTGKSLVGKSNPNCSSDLGVGALGLLACAKGVYLNVLTNLPGIKDPDLEKDFEMRGKKLYAEAESLANSIYDMVKESL